MNSRSTSTPPHASKRVGMARWKKLAIAGGVAVVALGAVGVWWFLRDDAPSAVNLDAAVGAVGTSGTSGATGTAASAGGVDGGWKVDTSVGQFDFENSTGTFVGFRVNEQLSGIGSATAVGRTPAVSGTMTIDGNKLTAANFSADMTALTTNNSRRDGPARQALGTSQFPTATFVLTAPIDLGDAAKTGAKTKVTASGNLTVHGVTKSVQFPLEAQLTGDTIVVVGSLDVVFSDFGITAPTAPIVLSVDDHGQIELQLFFQRA
jgi:polyisoprenoid-binding protein YceI